jgi:hypothetical protein
MGYKNLITALLLCVAIGGILKVTIFHRPTMAYQESAHVDAQRPAFIATAADPALLVAGKLTLDLRLLARNNPNFVAKNSADFFKPKNKITWDQIYIPAGSSFMLELVQSCSLHQMATCGTYNKTEGRQYLAKNDLPHFVHFKTAIDLSAGRLKDLVEADKCVNSLSVASSIEAALEPQGGIAASSFDPQSFISEARNKTLDNLKNDISHPATVLFLGSRAEKFGLKESDQAYSVWPLNIELPDQGAQFYIAPIRHVVDATEESVELNNMIVVMAARGTNFIMLPQLNPTLISKATELAWSKQTRVYRLATRDRLPVTVLNRSPGSNKTASND